MRKFYFLVLGIILIFGVAISVHSQKLSTESKKAEGLYNKALSYYRSHKFELAKGPLNQALKKDNQFVEAHHLMSEVFFEQKNYARQIEYLENIIRIDSTYLIFCYYSLGEANFNIKNYVQSIEWFKKYLTKTKDTKYRRKSEEWIKRALFAQETLEKPKNIEAKNLGPAVNSKYNEYWPSITADEQTLVYTVLVARDSAINQQPYPMAMSNLYHEDFYRTVKDENGKWTNRIRLPKPINTLSNEGAQALSTDGNWMFFTACGRSDSRGSCDIYFSYRTANGWSSPKNIGAPVNTPFWESQPSFSSDGRTLYYTCNRAGGKGGNDIWRARIIGLKPDGTPYFSRPENLGDMVNTVADELSPFIHPDNNTLYFASEGWPGLGQADLFMAKMEDDEFVSEPINLGYPINTEGDEVGLVITASGDKAFFSSDRYEDSQGGRDIYTFNMPKEFQPRPVSYVKGRVFDIRTRKQLNASFELKNLSDGKMVVEAQSTGFSGEFLVCLPQRGSYALNVSKKGYLFYSDHFEMDSTSTLKDPQILNIFLKPLRVGEQIVLNNIFFETDSYQLKSQSEVELQRLILFLNENEKLKIQLIGHTDNVGSQEYNLNLSAQRAREVYRYLVNAGINADRLSFKGEGMKQPVASNDTKEGRAKNRRTEMKIVE